MFLTHPLHPLQNQLLTSAANIRYQIRKTYKNNNKKILTETDRRARIGATKLLIP
ncbi:MAG: hypothetical protein F6K35_49975 [Okeania sp. SIO2H7]|nr:hypothetical protein [Okeania sp. SIO2H7]